MKKNDIIDKLNIINRKIDDMPLMAHWRSRLTRVSAKHVFHWCKPSMCLQHLRKMPEIPTKQPFPATFVNFISILSQKEKTSHIDPFK